jgi:lipoate---protein ligase
VDTETLLTVLRAPREKLSPLGVQSARERFITLTELAERHGVPCSGAGDDLEGALQAAFCEAFGLTALGDEVPEPEAPVPPPEPVAAELEQDWNAVRDRTWQAFEPTPGGVLHLRLDPDAGGTRIRHATLAGAVHVSPPTLLADLARELTVAAPGAAEARWRRYLGDGEAQLLGFEAGDLYRLLRRALNRDAEQRLGMTTEQANTLMVHPAGGVDSAREILDRATVMLVPYCAKPAWCKWRHRDGCPECGQCEVGDAYRMARERGMRVVTITRFEHLRAVLDQMRRDGEPAYVGMCCGNFYLKRAQAFREAGMPAVLMDISGANCYELRQEDQAYAGQFTAEARLNGEVVEKVMRWVPRVR